MIAVFLLPFPLRGYRAPYLWVYYRLMSSIRERMQFIVSEDYARNPEYWESQKRWEVLPGNAERLQYRVPSRETISSHEYQFLSEGIWERLLADCGGNPLAAFRRLLSERVPYLEAAFTEVFSHASVHNIESVLTWCNCPSLSAAAHAKGIQVVHLEIGPLRWPHYRPTAFFDFSGVNGNTEVERRYLRSNFQPNSEFDARELRRFFYLAGEKALPGELFKTGVALQVEDDSNLLAFSHGFDNQSLLIYSHLRRPDGNVLVRAHPGSLFALKPDWYEVDDSSDSVTFICRCEQILTINSSVGLEAILMDIPVEVLGDCAHRFIVEACSERERTSRLAFYLFAYLVPMDLIYDMDYLRFRLSLPTEAEIVARHLACYLGSDDRVLGLDAKPDMLIRSALDSSLTNASDFIRT